MVLQCRVCRKYSKATNWYILQDHIVINKIQHVLKYDMSLQPYHEETPLPRRISQSLTSRDSLNCYLLPEHYIATINDEIDRRMVLEFQRELNDEDSENEEDP